MQKETVTYFFLPVSLYNSSNCLGPEVVMTTLEDLFCFILSCDIHASTCKYNLFNCSSFFWTLLSWIFLGNSLEENMFGFSPTGL